MELCNACGTGRLETSVLTEHTEDLGGITVTLRNAVLLHHCQLCNEEMTEIPDARELYKAVALKRVMLPVQLTGSDIRFMRAVFDMTQAQFAEAVGMDNAQTISRWENGVRGVGGYADKLVRYVIHARLHKAVPASDYDPEAIGLMRIRQLAEGERLPPLVLSRVVVKHDHRREQGWDPLPQAA